MTFLAEMQFSKQRKRAEVRGWTRRTSDPSRVGRESQRMGGGRKWESFIPIFLNEAQRNLSNPRFGSRKQGETGFPSAARLFWKRSYKIRGLPEAKNGLSLEICFFPVFGCLQSGNFYTICK